jgi:hypothetical protein
MNASAERLTRIQVALYRTGHSADLARDLEEILDDDPAWTFKQIAVAYGHDLAEELRRQDLV